MLAESPDAVTTGAPDWFSKAIAVEARQEVIQVGGTDVVVRRWDGSDSGTPVLLIHGGTANSHWWDHIAPLLGTEGEVVAIDLSGHGDSGWSDHYSLRGWAVEVAAVASRFTSAKPPVVIGHSMGGLVAIRTAQDHGGGLAGIVIVDTFLAGRSASPPAARTVPRLHTGATCAEMVDRFQLVPDAPALSFTREHVARHAVRESDGQWQWKFDPAILINAFLDELEPHEASCPIRVVRGEAGDMSDESLAGLTELGGTVERVTTVEDAGHHLMLDRPLDLVAALRSDLSGLSGLYVSVR